MALRYAVAFLLEPRVWDKQRFLTILVLLSITRRKGEDRGRSEGCPSSTGTKHIFTSCTNKRTSVGRWYKCRPTAKMGIK
jgi:hypothetical protein